jgi:hypothetical protein
MSGCVEPAPLEQAGSAAAGYTPCPVAPGPFLSRADELFDCLSIFHEWEGTIHALTMSDWDDP